MAFILTHKPGRCTGSRMRVTAPLGANGIIIGCYWNFMSREATEPLFMHCWLCQLPQKEGLQSHTRKLFHSQCHFNGNQHREMGPPL